MKYNNLSLQSKRAKTRVGRGIAAGKGKTAGRGTKGQNARTGGGVRPGFEGGQNPLMQRLPKLRGFRPVKPSAEAVYTGQINTLGLVVDNKTLFEAGLVTTPYGRVKLILNGDISKKITISVQAASNSAKAAVEKAGGKVIITERPKQTKQKKQHNKRAK